MEKVPMIPSEVLRWVRIVVCLVSLAIIFAFPKQNELHAGLAIFSLTLAFFAWATDRDTH